MKIHNVPYPENIEFILDDQQMIIGDEVFEADSSVINNALPCAGCYFDRNSFKDETFTKLCCYVFKCVLDIRVDKTNIIWREIK